MALLHIPLVRIERLHLQALIDAGAAESRTIDYKRETYGPTEKDHREFLADVSSFANTAGGDLVLGMTADKGTPMAFNPLTIAIDAERLRFEQIMRTGLQPRLNIDFHSIAVDAGHVLIVRIPRSYHAPHRIISQNSNRFWARSSGGKYEPNVDELRLIFNAAPQLADRMRDFRMDRVAKIAAGMAPVLLQDQATLVMHIIPFSAFDQLPDLSLKEVSKDLFSFVPMRSRMWQSTRINFDGVLKLSNADNEAKQQRAYVQLYRSGIVEAANSGIVASKHPVLLNLEDNLVADVGRYLGDLVSLGIEPPYAMFLSFLGLKDIRMDMARGGSGPIYDDLGKPFDRDQYHFSEVVFETVPETQEAAATALRSLLDQLANAAGEPWSRSFHPEDGRYIPLKA